MRESGRPGSFAALDCSTHMPKRAIRFLLETQQLRYSEPCATNTCSESVKIARSYVYTFCKNTAAAGDFSKHARLHHILTDLEALLAHHRLGLRLLLAEDSLHRHGEKKWELLGNDQQHSENFAPIGRYQNHGSPHRDTVVGRPKTAVLQGGPTNVYGVLLVRKTAPNREKQSG